MRYEYGFAVSIPYMSAQEDGTTSLERVLLSTNTPCDRRRVKRTIRQWVKEALGRQLYTSELLLIMRQVIKHKENTTYVRVRSQVDG